MPLYQQLCNFLWVHDLSDPVAGWSEVSGKKGLRLSTYKRDEERDSHVPTR
jgi:hypothetical protein